MNFLYLPQHFFSEQYSNPLTHYYRYNAVLNGGKSEHVISLFPDHKKLDLGEYFFEFEDRQIIYDGIFGGEDDENIINVLTWDDEDDDIY